MLLGIKIKIKSVAELNCNSHLKINVDPKRFVSARAFKSTSPKWLGIFG